MIKGGREVPPDQRNISQHHLFNQRILQLLKCLQHQGRKQFRNRSNKIVTVYIFSSLSGANNVNQYSSFNGTYKVVVTVILSNITLIRYISFAGTASDHPKASDEKIIM